MEAEQVTPVASSPEPIAQESRPLPPEPVSASPEPSPPSGGQAAAASPSIPSTPAAPTAPTLSGLREYFKTKHNTDLSSFSGDDVLADQLFTSAREVQQLRSAYERQKADLERFQAQTAKPAAEAPKSILERKPEWDARWAQMVVKDQITGELRAAPGAPAGIVDKVNQYVGWSNDWQDMLTNNPQEAAKVMFSGQLEKMLEEKMSGYKQQTLAQQLIEQNAGWLYAKDANGQAVRGMDGQPQISQAGQRYLQHSNAAAQMGITDVQAQHTYAERLTRAEAILAQQQQTPAAAGAAPGLTPAQAVNEQHKQNLLQQSTHTPNRNGALPGNGVTTPVKSDAGLSLRDKLSRRMVGAGLNLDDPIEI